MNKSPLYEMMAVVEAEMERARADRELILRALVQFHAQALDAGNYILARDCRELVGRLEAPRPQGRLQERRLR